MPETQDLKKLSAADLIAEIVAEFYPLDMMADESRPFTLLTEAIRRLCPADPPPNPIWIEPDPKAERLYREMLGGELKRGADLGFKTISEEDLKALGVPGGPSEATMRRVLGDNPKPELPIVGHTLLDVLNAHIHVGQGEACGVQILPGQVAIAWKGDLERGIVDNRPSIWGLDHVVPMIVLHRADGPDALQKLADWLRIG